MEAQGFCSACMDRLLSTMRWHRECFVHWVHKYLYHLHKSVILKPRVAAEQAEVLIDNNETERQWQDKVHLWTNHLQVQGVIFFFYLRATTSYIPWDLGSTEQHIILFAMWSLLFRRLLGEIVCGLPEECHNSVDVRLGLPDVCLAGVAPPFCEMMSCAGLHQKVPRRICIYHHPGRSPIPKSPPLSPFPSQKAPCFPGKWYLACVCQSCKGNR